MKILNVDQIRAADAYTIEQEPIASIDLMERASEVFCERFLSVFSRPTEVIVLCGNGNNGGDGLAIARLLRQRGVPTKAFVDLEGKRSKDNEVNLKRLDGAVSTWDDFVHLEIRPDAIVIDALFGSGLNRALQGKAKEIIRHVNERFVRRVAVDIPSGLGADQVFEGVIFRAHETITFQWPKRTFFFDEVLECIGNLHVVDIGLSSEYESSTWANAFWMDKYLAKSFFKPRRVSAHKYDYGRGLLVAGHQGMMGASILASRAAVRSGIGLLKSHVPHGGGQLLHESVPELMVELDDSHDCITRIQRQQGMSAFAFGPGIGRDGRTRNALVDLMQQAADQGLPMVIDADGLFHLAQIMQDHPDFEYPELVLTPHLGELSTLAGRKLSRSEARVFAAQFAKDRSVILLLKGACTEVYHPNGEVYALNEGVPGMATAGSGDVLTGVILALLAQGYGTLKATLLGAYIHGAAGRLAALEKGQTSLIASDIIDYLSVVFKQLEN